MRANILIVEDEEFTRKKMLNILRQNFSNDSNIIAVENGTSALEKIKQYGFHLVLLDVMLPDMDGFHIAKELTKKNIPFYMISSRDLPQDVIDGFKAGAQDYLRKPVDEQELLVRVQHYLQKNKDAKNLHKKISQEDVISIGNITVDKLIRKIYIDGVEVELSPLEWQIFLLLFENIGYFVSTEEIIHELYNNQKYESLSNDASLAVRAHIRRLRSKIEENPAQPKYIINKWGAGYKFNVNKD